MSAGEPQRLATWILTRCTAVSIRDALIGDLMEQYAERGDWWYWRQALGAVRAHGARLLWTATETHVPAAEYIGDLVMCIALGMCGLIQLPIYALLLISCTQLSASESRIDVVSALIAAAVFGMATTVHGLRMRAPAQAQAKLQPLWSAWLVPVGTQVEKN